MNEEDGQKALHLSQKLTTINNKIDQLDQSDQDLISLGLVSSLVRQDIVNNSTKLNYTVDKLFFAPPLVNDNRRLNALCEIEVDGQGNVYVLNSHHLNESDMMWKFDPDGKIIKEISFTAPGANPYVPAPTVLYLRPDDSRIYLSTARQPAAAQNTIIFELATNDFRKIRQFNIQNMGHVTGMTCSSDSKTLYVTGFTMRDIPDIVNDIYIKPFYHPYLAEISASAQSATSVSAHRLDSDPNSNLALPLSIVWTGDIDDGCGNANLDDNTWIDLYDFKILAQHWLENCKATSWCNEADVNRNTYVDLTDLRIMTQNWIKEECK